MLLYRYKYDRIHLLNCIQNDNSFEWLFPLLLKMGLFKMAPNLDHVLWREICKRLPGVCQTLTYETSCGIHLLLQSASHCSICTSQQYYLSGNDVNNTQLAHKYSKCYFIESAAHYFCVEVIKFFTLRVSHWIYWWLWNLYIVNDLSHFRKLYAIFWISDKKELKETRIPKM